MMIRSFIVLASLLLTTTNFADHTDRLKLLGLWNFQSSNKEIPPKCQNAYLNFVSISKIEGSDGSRKGVISYSAESIPSGHGFNLMTQKISHDGQPNCYGKKPNDANSSKLGLFFVMISPDGHLMKLYFSKDYYHVYKKAM